MNEQASKKILFNKSTLLSLKAELLKKQEEVHDKKRLQYHKVENFKPHLSKTSQVRDKDPSNTNKKSFKDGLKSIDAEELEASRKTKLALEKKAEIYEHLLDNAGDSQLADRFLVDFSNKKKQQTAEAAPEIIVEEDTDDHYEHEEDGNDWMEFTDCLGRTRKCLKSDLKLYLKRDHELMQAMNANQMNDDPNTIDVNDTKKSEKPFLVQKTNDYLQSLREKWEERERQLLAKDKDIHYQDLLFDEARMHGVGYYSFSTDEAERKSQMEELIKRRQETVQAQKEAEEQRRKRDELVGARVAAARARRRARAGLPPEDPEEKKKDFTACLLEFLNQQKNEADAKAKEEEIKLKEQEENERQKLREAFVREWDIGKEGVDEKLNTFREMTQEEYVEQQRLKRIEEFAPLQGVSSSISDVRFDDRGRSITSTNTASSENKKWADVRAKMKTPSPPIITDKTWANVRPIVKVPPLPSMSDIENAFERKGLYFSTIGNKDRNSTFSTQNKTMPKVISKLSSHCETESDLDQQIYNVSIKKESKSIVKYKNFVKDSKPSSTLIVNELSDDETSEIDLNLRKRQLEPDQSQVSPPLTFEYYGPVSKTQKIFRKTFDAQEAYAQGTKSLESKTSNRQLPQHYDFTFD